MLVPQLTHNRNALSPHSSNRNIYESNQITQKSKHTNHHVLGSEMVHAVHGHLCCGPIAVRLTLTHASLEDLDVPVRQNMSKKVRNEGLVRTKE